MSADTAVVIVGAGPVGVTAATLLARRGIASVLLEKYQAPYPPPRRLAGSGRLRRPGGPRAAMDRAPGTSPAAPMRCRVWLAASPR